MRPDLSWADYVAELARHHLEPADGDPGAVHDRLTGRTYAAHHIARRDTTIGAAVIWASLARARAGIEPPHHLPPPPRRALPPLSNLVEFRRDQARSDEVRDPARSWPFRPLATTHLEPRP